MISSVFTGVRDHPRFLNETIKAVGLPCSGSWTDASEHSGTSTMTPKFNTHCVRCKTHCVLISCHLLTAFPLSLHKHTIISVWGNCSEQPSYWLTNLCRWQELLGLLSIIHFSGFRFCIYVCSMIQFISPQCKYVMGKDKETIQTKPIKPKAAASLEVPCQPKTDHCESVFFKWLSSIVSWLVFCLLH